METFKIVEKNLYLVNAAGCHLIKKVMPPFPEGEEIQSFDIDAGRKVTSGSVLSSVDGKMVWSPNE